MKSKSLLIFVLLIIFSVSSCDNENQVATSATGSGDDGNNQQVVTNNQPVLKLASTEISVIIDETVTLDASGSTDEDKDDTLYFQWTDVDGLFASQNIALTDSKIEGTADKLGTFHFTVEVSDGAGGAVTGEVVVEVKRTYTTAQYSLTVSAENSDIKNIVDVEDLIDIYLSVNDPDIEKFGDKDSCTLLMYSIGVTSVYSKFVTFETNYTSLSLIGINLKQIFGNHEGKFYIGVSCKESSEAGYDIQQLSFSFLRFKMLTDGSGESQAIFVSPKYVMPTSDVTVCYNESITDSSKYGTPYFPYHCLTNAVERAKIETHRKNIYIAQGFYNEQVNLNYLPDGANPSVVKGGYDVNWDYNENVFKPVLYYNPAGTIPSDDYDTPVFRTYTLGFISNNTNETALWLRVENMVILPSKPNVIGTARAVILDSGETYAGTSNTPNGEITDIYFNNCIFAPYFYNETDIKKLNFIEGLQAERVWFNRILFTDDSTLSGIVGLSLPDSISALNGIISHDASVTQKQHFHDIGLSNSIAVIGHNVEITYLIFADFHTDYFALGPQWFLFNTIYLRSTDNVAFYNSPYAFINNIGELHVVGNLINIESEITTTIFYYSYSADYFKQYIWGGADNNTTGAGSCMFNVFYRDNSNNISILNNNGTKYYSLESYDKKVNESSNNARAESRYNFSINIEGQYANVTTESIYGGDIVGFVGIDSAYIPTSDELHFPDSSWQGEPFGYFTYDEITTKDFFGNNRQVNIENVFNLNFDELDVGYRDPSYPKINGQDIFRRNTSNDLGAKFFEIDDSNIPIDIGAIELQK